MCPFQFRSGYFQCSKATRGYLLLPDCTVPLQINCQDLSSWLQHWAHAVIPWPPVPPLFSKPKFSSGIIFSSMMARTSQTSQLSVLSTAFSAAALSNLHSKPSCYVSVISQTVFKSKDLLLFILYLALSSGPDAQRLWTLAT